MELSPREQARRENVPENQLHHYPDDDETDMRQLGASSTPTHHPGKFNSLNGDIEQGKYRNEAAQRADIYRDRIVDGETLNRRQFPPLQWTVQDILSEGYGLLAAPPKAGKSWLVAGIGIACAEGTPAFKHIDVQQRPVLYFALEDSHRRLQSRFRKITGRDYIPPLMHVVTRADDLDNLVGIARQFQDDHQDQAPPLIIVDTLAKVAPGRLMSQSQYQSEYSLGAALQQLAKRVPGSTVLAVHHTNKGEHNDFINGVSGTQGTTGACDVVLVMNRARKSNDAVLSVTGRDIERETEYAITMDNGVWSLKGDSLVDSESAAAQVKAEQHEAAIEARYGDRTVAILSLVRERINDGAEHVAPADIADEAGMSNAEIGKYLGRLAKRGDLVREGRGKYVLPPEYETGGLVQDQLTSAHRPLS